jgi:TonB family protein
MTFLHSVPAAEWIMNLAIEAVILLVIGRSLLFFVRRRPAPLRSGIAVSTLLVLAMLPILSLTSLEWRGPVFEVPYAPKDTPPPVQELPTAGGQIVSASEEGPAATGTIGERERVPIYGELLPQISIVEVINLLGIAWGIGVVWFLVRFIHGVRSIGKIRSGSIPIVGPRLARILGEASKSLGMPVRAKVCASSEVDGPVAVGFIRPVILLPRDLFEKAADRDVRAIFSHELSHVLHRDYLLGLIQRWILALNWWNPLAHGLNAELSHAREEVSDNHVLRGNESRYYAECLVNLAEKASRVGRRQVAVAMASPHIPLKDRIKTILSKERTMETQLNKRTVITIALAAFLVVGLTAGYKLTFAAGHSDPAVEPAAPGADVSPADNDGQEKKVDNPKLIKRVEPVYPEEARKAGTEGTIVLELKIDTKGAVEAVKILKAGPEALNKAAVEAVKQWKYEPMVIDGEAKPVLATVTVRFALKDKKSTVGTWEKTGTDSETRPPVQAKGDVKPPKLIKKIDPIYPEEARKAGIHGVVILEATTDKEGKVVDVKVLRSIPELNQAAVDALKQWVYEPMIIDGQPQGVTFTVTVRFNLK